MDRSLDWGRVEMATKRVRQDSVARIVERAGWLELRRDDGVILCTMVYGRGSGELRRRARAYLIIEARSLGYAPIAQARDGDPPPAWT
jgi:hypothetical protein